MRKRGGYDYFEFFTEMMECAQKGAKLLEHTLENFDPSTLKSVMEKMHEIEHSADDQKLVETIVIIAHVFGCSVVAEGIETDAQLDVLRRLGCDQGQGYLFSRPLERADFEARLCGAG